MIIFNDGNPCKQYSLVTRKIYLAGGWTNWRDIVISLLNNCEFSDPRILHNTSHWFESEVKMISECDAIICYISKDDPSGYGSTFEMGMAFALKKPYILINEKENEYQWGMQTRGSFKNFKTLRDAFDWIDQTKWMGLDLLKYEYYQEAIPCKHGGCLHHRTHPCEYCGRIEGRGDAYVRTEYERENYARRENCRHGRENHIQK